MATLTYAQLEGLWLNVAKGTKYDSHTWAALMAAIAMAESGGNASALNPNDNNGTQSSFGLWQISTGTHQPPSPGWADPATNAQLAIGKLDGQGLTAWGTYDSGAYKAYLNGSTTPDTNVPGNPDATLLAAQGNPADCAWKLPAVTVPVIPGVFSQTIAPGACLVRKSEVRAVYAVLLIGAGGVVALSGVAFLAVYGFKYEVASKLIGPILGMLKQYDASGAGPRYQPKRAGP